MDKITLNPAELSIKTRDVDNKLEADVRIDGKARDLLVSFAILAYALHDGVGISYGALEIAARNAETMLSMLHIDSSVVIDSNALRKALGQEK